MKGFFTTVLGSIVLTAGLLAVAAGSLLASPHSTAMVAKPAVAKGKLDPGELVLTGALRPRKLVVSTADLAALPQLVEDGVPLAHPRLIVPGDIRGGRFVTDVVRLELEEARA